MMLHMSVGGRGEHALVSVFPPDQIRRRAAVPVDLDDHPRAVRITYMASPDDQFIADFRTHRLPPSHGFHKINVVAGIRPGGGPKVHTSSPVGPDPASGSLRIIAQYGFGAE